MESKNSRIWELRRGGGEGGGRGGRGGGGDVVQIQGHRCLFKLALLSPNSISCKIPQGFGELPQGEKIRRPQQIVFLSYCLQETYIFLGDIHFSRRHTFFLETYIFQLETCIFLIGVIHFSWRHTFFLSETYISLGEIHFSRRHTFFSETYIFLGDIHFSWRHTFSNWRQGFF